MKKLQKRVDMKRAALYAIIINSLQIVLVGVIALYMLFEPEVRSSTHVDSIIILSAVLLVTWGAVVDIREAVSARKTLYKVRDMERTMGNIEELNRALRIQRHDFLNHLQVVYSLIEMDEFSDANAYIEKVYGDMSSLSHALKTKNTAVNALLRAKLMQMDKQGITCQLDIRSAWEDLPIPGWEVCRVLSNLIDNAIDALEGCAEKSISIILAENLKQFTFTVANNGPCIPDKMRDCLFVPGVTTKQEGHGMGLFIVKKTLESHGGAIEVQSGETLTQFTGSIPKKTALA